MTRKSPPPTKRQVEVLAAIWKHTNKHGWPPTLRELGEALGFSSTNAVWQHLDALETKGLIEREPQSGRAVKLTRAGERWLE